MQNESFYTVIRRINSQQIKLYNNITNKEEIVSSHSVDMFLEDGICVPSIKILPKLESGRSYVIAFETVYRAKVYYSGFNISFKNNVGITADLNEAKVYRDVNKLLNAVNKLVTKCEALFIMIIEVKQGGD